MLCDPAKPAAFTLRNLMKMRVVGGAWENCETPTLGTILQSPVQLVSGFFRDIPSAEGYIPKSLADI